MMPSIYLTCPVCSEEIECEMQYEAPEYDINVSGGWLLGFFVHDPHCPLTPEQEAALETEAEQRANDDGGFGVSHWEE
jgi:hypothetical protein